MATAEPAIWTSADGSTWSAVPMELDNDNSFQTFIPTVIAGNAFATVAARASPTSSPQRSSNRWYVRPYGLDSTPTDTTSKSEKSVIGSKSTFSDRLVLS